MTRSADGLTTAEQLAKIGDRVQLLATTHARIFLDEIAPALADSSIRIVRWADISREQQQSLEEIFDNRIFPVLTPLRSKLGCRSTRRIARLNTPLTPR